MDFLPVDKHQRFLQIDTIVLGVYGKACLNYHKFAISLQYLKKEVSNEADFFCMQISMKVSYKLIL